MWCVYMIQHSESKEFYVGFTSDTEERLKAHNSGSNRSTKRLSGEWVLVYYEAFRSESDARLREKKLKSHARGKHELLKRLANSIM